MEYNKKENCNKFFTNPGDRFQVEYDTIVDPTGRVTIKEAGKKDIFQEIQSWKDQTDMHYILNQMALGQYPQRTDIMYGDFTEAPENMQQAMQMMINAERAFYDLPLDVRKKFDNDYKQWMVQAQTDFTGFAEKMGVDQAGAAAPEEEKVGVE